MKEILVAEFIENPGARRKIDQALKDNLRIVGEYLATMTRLNVSGQGVNPGLKAVDTGQHLSSIFWKQEDDIVIVGFDGSAAHSYFVELGTKYMPARPSLQQAVYGNKDMVKRILEHGK